MSAYWGLALGLATSLLSAAAFNFFHLPPTGRFTIADSRNWVALAAFIIVAVVVSTVAELARSRALEAERRRAQADLAAALARELLAESQTKDGLAAAARHVAEALAIPSASIVLGAANGDARRRALALSDADRQPDRDAARPARSSRRDARSGSQTHVVPALEAIVAIALRRDAIQAEAVETEALRRSDDVKTALLRAVSHDLRTPLTAIVAAGHALATPSLTPEEQTELSQAVVAEGERLAALVEKLLDLSKLQAGRAEPRRDWVSLEDVLFAAQRERARGRRRDPRHDRAAAARGHGRRRPARARVREPARERGALLARPSGVGLRPQHRHARCSCGSSTRGPGSSPPSASGSSSRSTAAPRGQRPLDRIGPGPGDREGLRRGQRRHDLGRVAAGPGNDLRRLAPARAHRRRRSSA